MNEIKTHIYKGSSIQITMCLQNAEHLACLAPSEIEERKLPVETINCKVCLEMFRASFVLGRRMALVEFFELKHISTWFPDDLPIITEGENY